MLWKVSEEPPTCSAPNWPLGPFRGSGWLATHDDANNSSNRHRLAVSTALHIA